MCGKTTSLSCWSVEAPASLAVSRCDGGTFSRAAPYSIIENAVPRQTLNTMIDIMGWSSSQAKPGVRRIAFSVPPSRSSSAIHRNATTDDGRIHASSTSPSVTLFSGPRRSRSTHAIANPSTACPSTAEPSTNCTVSHSDVRNRSSPSASA